jgi:uncharacterized membrane protein YgaE (UPF0421/DUF939 family)
MYFRKWKYLEVLGVLVTIFLPRLYVARHMREVFRHSELVMTRLALQVSCIEGRLVSELEVYLVCVCVYIYTHTEGC